MNEMRKLGAAWVFALLSCAACSSSGDGAPSGPTDASSNDAVPDSSDATSSDGLADRAETDPVPIDCTAKINAYRAKVSAAPVTLFVDDVACAGDQAAKGAADLAATGKTTFHKYFGQCTETFQNECWYSVNDPDAVIDWCLDGFWKEGPPETGINHYSVMSDPKSTRVACALRPRVGGGYWMTNDYY
jgi:hypothetical protein